jgi:hypothetical protein
MPRPWPILATKKPPPAFDDGGFFAIQTDIRSWKAVMLAGREKRFAAYLKKIAEIKSALFLVTWHNATTFQRALKTVGQQTSSAPAVYWLDARHRALG